MQPMQQTPEINPADKLSVPAIIILIIGILNLLGSLFGILWWLIGALFGGTGGQEFKDIGEKVGYTFGYVLPLISSVTGLLFAPFIIYGAIQMKRARKFLFARTASIMVMLPFASCCCWLGLPFGIWAAIVMSKPEVKAAFPD